MRCALALTALASAYAAAAPGVAVSVTPSFIETSYAVAEPMIKKTLLEMVMPDTTVHASGIDIQIRKGRITKFQCDRPPCFVASMAPGVIVGGISDYSITAVADISTTFFVPLTTTVTTQLTGFGGIVDLSPVAVDGHPQVHCDKAVVTVRNVTASFDGGPAWILNSLRPIIEQAVITLIQKQAPTIIQDVMTKVVNPKLMEAPTSVAIPNATKPYAHVSVALTQNPIVTVNHTVVVATGSVTVAEQCPTDVPLPYIAPKPLPTLNGFTGVEVAVSDTVVRQTIYAASACRAIAARYAGQNIDVGSYGAFNTSWMSWVAPGLSKFPDKWMALIVRPHLPAGVPTTVFSRGGVAVSVGVSFEFVVVDGAARLRELAAAAGVAVEDYKVGQVQPRSRDSEEGNAFERSLAALAAAAKGVATGVSTAVGGKTVTDGADEAAENDHGEADVPTKPKGGFIGGIQNGIDRILGNRANRGTAGGDPLTAADGAARDAATAADATSEMVAALKAKAKAAKWSHAAGAKAGKEAAKWRGGAGEAGGSSGWRSIPAKPTTGASSTRLRRASTAAADESTTIAAADAGSTLVDWLTSLADVSEDGDFSAFTLACNFSASGLIIPSVNGANVTLHGKVQHFACPLMMVETNVGDIHSDALRVITNTVISNVVVPDIQKRLDAGITFQLPELPVDVRDAGVEYHDGAILVGLSATVPART